jgi:hypothetical protein
LNGADYEKQNRDLRSRNGRRHAPPAQEDHGFGKAPAERRQRIVHTRQNFLTVGPRDDSVAFETRGSRNWKNWQLQRREYRREPRILLPQLWNVDEAIAISLSWRRRLPPLTGRCKEAISTSLNSANLVLRHVLRTIRHPTAHREDMSDCFDFLVPRASFDQLADDHGSDRIVALGIKPGVASNDPIGLHLGSCLKSAIERHDVANDQFIDRLTTALNVHFSRLYVGMHFPRRAMPWPMR